MNKSKILKGAALAALIFISVFSIFYDGFAAESIVDYKDLMPNHTLSLHAINVDQGAATLIKTKSKNVLIDTGERAYSKNLTDYLKAEGVEKLDYLFITHPHRDHYGAVSRLLEDVEVKKAFFPVMPENLEPDDELWYDTISTLEENNVEIFFADKKQDFPLGANARLKLIGPFLAEPKNLNDMSLCFKLDVGEMSFLITGDGEKAVESALMKEDIEADVLLSGHHGSKTSANEFFVDKVKPQASVVSVGFDNNHGLPDRVHLDNLLKWGDVFRTDLEGSIVFVTDGRSIAAAKEKDVI